MITGGTGLVGMALSGMLVKDGYNVTVLSRKPIAASDEPGVEGQGHIKFATWDVKAGTIDIAALQQADHIIHLAGAGVMNKKWTQEFRQEIRDSRTKSSELIINTLRNNPNKVQSVISASATGWYKEDPIGSIANPHTEEEPADDSFLGETCRLWEAGIQPVRALGKRSVRLRIGIVLSNKGGALQEFEKPLKFGIAGILGNGKQIVSWIHIDDLCRLFIYAMKHDQLTGSFNAVAPNPVSNKELTLTLAKKRNGNTFISMPVPTFILKMMMGARSTEILKSNNVSDEKIRKSGYQFLYPTIDSALQDLYGDKK